MKDAVDGNFVRDALDGGDRLGFLGSGDTHDGHPGCPDPATKRRCGLVGIFAEERTREGVLAALRAGEYVYVRVLLGDARAAWSSPFFVE